MYTTKDITVRFFLLQRSSIFKFVDIIYHTKLVGASGAERCACKESDLSRPFYTDKLTSAEITTIIW